MTEQTITQTDISLEELFEQDLPCAGRHDKECPVGEAATTRLKCRNCPHAKLLGDSCMVDLMNQVNQPMPEFGGPMWFTCPKCKVIGPFSEIVIVRKI